MSASSRSSRSRLVVTVTGIVYALVGLALAAGGAWLVALRGSLYYLIAGLGILIAGALLIARRRAALWVYAAVLIGTLAWAVSEIGFDWWPLAARGDVVFPLGLWLLTPWIARDLDGGVGAAPTNNWATTLPLWVGVVASVRRAGDRPRHHLSRDQRHDGHGRRRDQAGGAERRCGAAG